MKKINVYLTEHMLEKINKMNKETGISKSEIIRRAILEFFDKK